MPISRNSLFPDYTNGKRFDKHFKDYTSSRLAKKYYGVRCAYIIDLIILSVLTGDPKGILCMHPELSSVITHWWETISCP